MSSRQERRKELNQKRTATVTEYDLCCGACKGQCKVKCQLCNGKANSDKPCVNCHSTGLKKCGICNGNGTIPSTYVR